MKKRVPGSGNSWGKSPAVATCSRNSEEASMAGSEGTGSRGRVAEVREEKAGRFSQGMGGHIKVLALTLNEVASHHRSFRGNIMQPKISKDHTVSPLLRVNPMGHHV